MNFKEHGLAGLATGLLVGAGTFYITKRADQSIVFALVTLAGSLAPDVDTGSIPSRIFAWIGIIASIFLMYKGLFKPAAIIGVVYMAFSSDKHRGFTHKWILPFGCFIVGALSLKFPQLARYLWLVPFGIGLACHYVVDKIPPYKVI